MEDGLTKEQNLESIIARLRKGINVNTAKIQIDVVYCLFCRTKLGVMVLDMKEAIGWKNEGLCYDCLQQKLHQRRV